MSTAIEKGVINRPDPIVLHVPIDEEVVLADDVKVPAGVSDLASFRKWMLSDDFPQRGRIDYVRGAISVDLSMEQFYTHHLIKNSYILVLELLMQSNDLGYVVGDHMRLTLPNQETSTEPDGMFILYDSIRTGKISKKPGRRGGVLEFEGIPDLVLEIVSDSSEEKDHDERPTAYGRAGVPEFWRVDARGPKIDFEVLVLAEGDFVPTLEADGWQRSNVLGKWFRLDQGIDPLGEPRFRLSVKD